MLRVYSFQCGLCQWNGLCEECLPHDMHGCELSPMWKVVWRLEGRPETTQQRAEQHQPHWGKNAWDGKKNLYVEGRTGRSGNDRNKNRGKAKAAKAGAQPSQSAWKAAQPKYQVGKGPCTIGCGRQRAEGYETCCRTCLQSKGKLLGQQSV